MGMRWMIMIMKEMELFPFSLGSFPIPREGSE